MDYIKIYRSRDLNTDRFSIFKRYGYDKKVIKSKFFIYSKGWYLAYGIYKDISDLDNTSDECNSCIFLIKFSENHQCCSSFISCDTINDFVITRLGNVMTLFLISYIRNNSKNLVIIREYD